MFTRIHNKLGTVGLLVAIVALVAALAGTAIAALPALNSKQKKEVTKIAKKYAGKQGPTGPQGPAAVGPAGPKGDTGSAGPTGKEGPPGPAETKLPSGKTSTGLWAFSEAGLGRGEYVPISFPLRVEPAPAEYEETKNFIDAGDPPTTQCPGTLSDPEAAPGQFCLYVREIVNASGPSLNINDTADRSSGMLLEFAIETEGEGYGNGTWAVTAK